MTHFEAHDERGVTKIKIPGQRIERHTTVNKEYEKKKLYNQTEQVEENDEKEKSPQKKVLKRRNLAIYTTNDDETE